MPSKSKDFNVYSVLTLQLKRWYYERRQKLHDCFFYSFCQSIMSPNQDAFFLLSTKIPLLTKVSLMNVDHIGPLKPNEEHVGTVITQRVGGMERRIDPPTKA